ncbi:LacI family DNA-binding transcriptional regulator [Streptomyces sp. NPDC048606]|uniref:LacI family DNA-binding transcriptional regulator n=1 Tax=Streptomyces sp. NPDC048606 TaxID=3154726 RepID=UPI00343F31E4
MKGQERVRTHGGKAPTLEEVARRAGVGRGTVSRVVNGSGKVSSGTRAAVEAAVAELGYVPHRAARALAGGRADAIALVVPRSAPHLDPDVDLALSALVHGVGATLAERDLQLVLTFAGEERERARLLRYLSARRVDGVLLLSARAGDPLPELVAELGVPVVLAGRRQERETLPSVGFDERGGAAAAVGHLLRRGRRAIAALTGAPEAYAPRCRLGGYRQALEGAGRGVDERLIAVAECSEAGGRRAMRELLERRPGLDAVFAASDLMAAGAGRELRAAGRRIPGDVALVGFGDSPVAPFLEPPLTSVRRPAAELGRAVTRMLLELISAEPAGEDRRPERTLLLPTRLIVRESS